MSRRLARQTVHSATKTAGVVLLTATFVAWGTPRIALANSPVKARIVILGDSLAAGYGLPPQQAFPARLQQRIDAAGLPFAIINAGVTGDTTGHGRCRVDRLLDQNNVRLLVVTLGGNDVLQAISPEQVEANLAAIFKAAETRSIPALLVGMRAVTSEDDEYIRRFDQVYPTLARKYNVPLIPFLLEGVAGEPRLNQADGLHPNADGAEKIADIVWPGLHEQLRAILASQGRPTIKP